MVNLIEVVRSPIIVELVDISAEAQPGGPAGGFPPAPPPSGGGSVEPGTGEIGVYSYSYAYRFPTVWMDGITVLNGEYAKYTENNISQLSGFSAELGETRLSGTLGVTLKLNGTLIGFQEFNNTNTERVQQIGLDRDLTANDEVTVELLTTSFTPLANQLDIQLIFN